MSNWNNFFCIIVIQSLVFIGIAYKYRKTNSVAKLLIQSCCIGIPFGIFFDLFFGTYIGIFSYYLGDGFFFLAINGVLSYGLMAATISLLHKETFLRFYGWIFGIGLVYEGANFLFPVWIWQFTDNFLLKLFVLHGAAYFGLAYLMAIALRSIIKRSFNMLGLS